MCKGFRATTFPRAPCLEQHGEPRVALLCPGHDGRTRIPLLGRELLRRLGTGKGHLGGQCCRYQGFLPAQQQRAFRRLTQLLSKWETLAGAAFVQKTLCKPARRLQIQGCPFRNNSGSCVSSNHMFPSTVLLEKVVHSMFHHYPNNEKTTKTLR